MVRKIGRFELKGVIPPIVTPFESGNERRIDEQSLRRLIRFLMDNGVHGIFVCGGVGEGLFLRSHERKRVTEITVDEVNGHLPVIAGVWEPCTDTALDAMKQIEDIGADAVMVIAPYYYRLSDNEVLGHFKTLGQNSRVPVMIYNLTRFCGYEVKENVLKGLADIENIVGIKESTHDLKVIAENIKLCGRKLSVFAGGFEIFLPTLMLGGDGCITGFMNCIPRLHVELFESFERGDLRKSVELFYKIMPLWTLGANPAMVKEALNVLGFSIGHPRQPLYPVNEESRQRLREVLSVLTENQSN